MSLSVSTGLNAVSVLAVFELTRVFVRDRAGRKEKVGYDLIVLAGVGNAH